MNPFRLGLGAALLAAGHVALAIQPIGAPQSSRPALSQSDIVERGGTVDGVDADKHTMLVDGVVYAVPRGSVRIHLAGNRVSTSLADLRRGTKIRFTSQQAHGSQHVQAREIWVTGVRPR